MKKQIMIALALAVLPGMASAADFSGTWVRDNAKSTTAPYPLYWITRAEVGSGGGGGNQGEYVITVRQTGANVQVTSANKPLRSYTADGQARVSKTDQGITNVTTTAAMQGENLTVTTVQPFGGMPGTVTLTTKETWSLSPDGRTLTVASASTVPARQQTFTEVYTKR